MATAKWPLESGHKPITKKHPDLFGSFKGQHDQGQQDSETLSEGNLPLRGSLRGSLRGRVSEVFRGFQRFLEVFRGFQRF